MKTLLNSCALAVLALGLVGQASAQVEVKTAPIHAVPADADQAGPAQARGELLSSLGPHASVAEQSPAPLTAEESAFFTALGHRITDAASGYEAYVRAASAIDARFTDGPSVQKALRVSEAYQPQQLQEGMVAYAAVLALRNVAFVEGVRATGFSNMGERLIANPDLVLQIRGADGAAADVAGVLRTQGQALAAAGRSIDRMAYDVQHDAWSKGAVADPAKVLAAAKTSALQSSTADADGERRLLQSIVAAPQSSVSGGVGAPPEVVRGLALAALAVLGQAGDAQEQRFAPLLKDARSADCLQMAKLNLNQCLAVAGPQYEDVFCLGKHAVGETAQCLMSAVAAPAIPASAPTTRLAALDPGPEIGAERAAAYGLPQPREAAEPETQAPSPPSRPQPYQGQAYQEQAYQAPDRGGEQSAPPRASAPSYPPGPYASQSYPDPAYAPGPYAPDSYPQRYYAPRNDGPYAAQAYAPQPYAPQQSYAPGPYAPGPYAQGPYAQGPYAPGPYAYADPDR